MRDGEMIEDIRPADGGTTFQVTLETLRDLVRDILFVADPPPPPPPPPASDPWRGDGFDLGLALGILLATSVMAMTYFVMTRED